MRRHSRFHFLTSFLTTSLFLASAVQVAPVLAVDDRSEPTIADHVPEPDEQVIYELSLADNVPENGSLTGADPYDWYCFKANTGDQITVEIVRTLGAMQPNCGLLRGVVDDGTQMTNLGQIIVATNSLDPDMVTLTYTPGFTGPVTLWVGSAGTVISGDYTVTMTGGEERTECTPCPTCVDNTAPPADEASFKFGSPVFMDPNLVEVPILVDTHDDISFTQMKIEFEGSCLTYDSVVIGASVTSPGAVFDDSTQAATTPGFDKSLLLQVSGEYSGCDQEVFVVTFKFAPGFTLPCKLTWDVSEPTQANGVNHLDTKVGSGGANRKILGEDINFCDDQIDCDSDIEITGDVLYYSNGTPIIANVPAGANPVTVHGNPTPTTTAMSPNATYALQFGPGPVNIALSASRPGGLTVCGSDEDGVLSGDDLLLLQNEVALTVPNKTFSDEQNLAGNVNGDGLALPDNSDVLALKRWIGRKVCDLSDACMPQGPQTKNCAATWRFIFFTDAGNPNVFTPDVGNLTAACLDTIVSIQGIFIGDVDGSWPNFFQKSGVPVNLAFEAKEQSRDEISVSLNVELEPGESLRHLIYSLEYEPAAVQYLGMQVGTAATNWGSFDNPETPGITHGIAHIPALAEPVTESGEIVVFKFRVLNEEIPSRLSFSRLKANDLDVDVPALAIGRGGVTSAVVPTHYSLKSQPNPFNPVTRVRFTIPEGVGSVPILLRVYDIAGRQVRTLVQGERGPGFHNITWNGRDEQGNALGAGVYLMRIHAGEWSAVEKVTLVK